MSIYRNRIFLGVFAVVAVASAFVFVSQRPSGSTFSETYKQNMRDALAEISLPTANNETQIREGVESLSDFIHYRSGLSISKENKERLITTENTIWNNSAKISANDLKNIFYRIAYEKIPKLNNEEINSITENLRGFDHAELPDSIKGGRDTIKIRTGNVSDMSHQDFSKELTNFRNGGIKNPIASTMIKLAISSEIDRKMNVIRAAEPGYFDGGKLTALQAILIAYAVVSDDQLTFDKPALGKRMNDLQQGIENFNKKPYPSPNGHTTYGDNGYLFSTPLSVVLNDANMHRLITLIGERANAK